MKNINEVCRRAVDQTSDYDAAVDLGIKMLESDSELQTREHQRIIREGVSAIIRQRRHTNRVVCKSAAMRRRGAEVIGECAAVPRITLLETWHVGNVKLGDATREDLEYSAKEERGRAKGHIENAVFYERLAQRLGLHNAKVRNCWRPEEVDAILADVQGEQAEQGADSLVG